MRKGSLAPVFTYLNPDPEKLMKPVRCKYKISSNNPRSTNICSWQNHVLAFVRACRFSDFNKIILTVKKGDEGEDDANFFY